MCRARQAASACGARAGSLHSRCSSTSIDVVKPCFTLFPLSAPPSSAGCMLSKRSPARAQVCAVVSVPAQGRATRHWVQHGPSGVASTFQTSFCAVFLPYTCGLKRT
ncbi:unnamed protein product [Prorocentrum cordatum]|uniref:Uncharacterized protein n=1 Tax=Prorocentrum cordatum TaxID=2364126 RepID=A0ABN9XRU3_9DINO|nr:unnamed protein product [Polarella glacialis]